MQVNEFSRKTILIDDVKLYFLVNKESIEIAGFSLIFSERFNSMIQINGVVKVVNNDQDVYETDILKPASLKFDFNFKGIETTDPLEPEYFDINVLDETISFSIEKETDEFIFGQTKMSIESDYNVILEFDHLEVKIL
jgi:hypothetical protein